MRVFLVPVADRPECATALRVAFDLASRVGASVEGCHMRPHSSSKVALPEALGNVVTDDALWASLARGKASGKTQRAARILFDAVADSYNYDLVNNPSQSATALWFERVGSPEKLLSIQGPVSDLIVVSRPAKKSSKLARLFMLSALMYTSRPVLIVPPKQKKPVGEHVVIAWNQSAEAGAAVAAAMPLLQGAGQVTIIRGSGASSAGPSARQLAQYLKFYGVRARQVAKPKKLGDSEGLVKVYRDCGGDLLVMGAYSRSRLTQRLFGGVTEHMLHKANIPVLMKHH